MYLAEIRWIQSGNGRYSGLINNVKSEDVCESRKQIERCVTALEFGLTTDFNEMVACHHVGVNAVAQSSGIGCSVELSEVKHAGWNVVCDMCRPLYFECVFMVKALDDC